MKQYVQHVSGQGEKWEVNSEDDRTAWGIHDQVRDTYYWLPKSDYILCDPPTVWKDVTAEVSDGVSLVHVTYGICSIAEGYRLRKKLLCHMHTGADVIEQWAFIVEQEVPQ